MSLPTIQRTLNRLVASGLLRRLDLSGRKKQYEPIERQQRGSLIDAATGQRTGFHSDGIEGLLQQALRQLGYQLLDYRLELTGVALPQRRGRRH